MTAYYNDFDEGAVEWLRELMRAGLIADGVVDDRSLTDVVPEDLHGFTQCHFFAGIGGWSYALRLAGWPDDRPVWTGSPPCQPFSAAGKLKGKLDDRHLAPHFIDLVGACRPAVLFGEQVASAEVFGKVASASRKRAAGPPAWAWLDDLSDRLEAARYAVGAVDFPSAGVGAPHIRQRTYFVARPADGLADPAVPGFQRRPAEGPPAGHKSGRASPEGGVANTAGGNPRAEREQPGREHGFQPQSGGAGGLADPEREQRQRRRAGEAVFEPGSVQRTERLRDADRLGNAGSPRGATGLPTPPRRHEGLAEELDDGSRGLPGRNAGRPGPVRVGDPGGEGLEGFRGGVVDIDEPGRLGAVADGQTARASHPGGRGSTRPMQANEFWRAADWLFCRDGKWRPVEPGSFPLAHGVSGRVGLLRGYGNAINPQQAAIFIEAAQEALSGERPFVSAGVLL